MFTEHIVCLLALGSSTLSVFPLEMARLVGVQADSEQLMAHSTGLGLLLNPRNKANISLGHGVISRLERWKTNMLKGCTTRVVEGGENHYFEEYSYLTDSVAQANTHSI